MEANELILDFKAESEFLVYLLNYRVQLCNFLNNSVVETTYENRVSVDTHIMTYEDKERFQNEIDCVDQQILVLRNYLVNNRA